MALSEMRHDRRTQNETVRGFSFRNSAKAVHTSTTSTLWSGPEPEVGCWEVSVENTQAEAGISVLGR